MTEQIKQFPVKLPMTGYNALVKESENREGKRFAAPTRTARQLIEERLKEIEESD